MHLAGSLLPTTRIAKLAGGFV